MRIQKHIFQKDLIEKKVISGMKIYKNNQKLIDTVETSFGVEKELLLALMGIETNYGTYVGKWI